MLRKVAFVGFSLRSNKAVFDGLPVDVEVWTVNHAHKFGWRIDRILEIHPLSYLTHPGYYTKETREQHLNYLYGEKGRTRVYMHRAWGDIPGSVAYPIEDVLKLCGYKRRLRSSFDYLAALAVLEGGIGEVQIYGFDMDWNEEEYRHQKPSALYWIGRMEGAGILVKIDGHSPLFEDAPLYGYQQGIKT